MTDQGRSLVREVVSVALPTAVANLSEYLPVTVSLAIVGREGSSEALDAVALARSYFNVTAFSVSYGLISALRTLCPQAAGAGKSGLQGVYAQRALVVTSVGLLPSIGLAFCAGRVLRVLGQPTGLSRMAQQYATRLIASVGGLNAMTILQRVMTAEGLARSNLMVCGAVCAAAPFVVWAFVSRFGWKGAAWASVVYNSLYVFLQVPVMVRAGRLRSVFRPRWKEALRTDGILEYLRLAVPGLVFICLEWWSLELLMVLGGTRPSAETVVGALAICLNLETVFELCWLGLAVGVSVCVGKAVGHADPLAARGAAKVGLLLAFGGGAVVAAGLVLGGASFAATLFSTRSKNDRPIARLVGKSAPALALMVWSDALNTTVQGALAGAGKPQAIAISNFVSWYGVGAPVAFFSVYYLQLDQAAVPALLACGAVAATTSFLIQMWVFFRRIDWDSAIHDASRRLLTATGGDEDDT